MDLILSHSLCVRYLALYMLLIKSSLAFTSNSSTKRVFIGTPAQKTHHLISDFMTPIGNLITLTQSSTVDEAVNILLKVGVSGAPVIHDTTGELLGVVSSFDFLQQEAGEGTLLPPIEGNSDQETLESYFSIAKKICATRVGDLMTTDIRTMECTESMKDAASLMAREKLHRLPIVDQDGKLVGLLTCSDVMIDMVNVVKNLPPAEEGDLGDENGNNHNLSP
jgi:CBS domain-containing protein